jgi:hypothetical protein
MTTPTKWVAANVRTTIESHAGPAWTDPCYKEKGQSAGSAALFPYL